MIPTYKVLSAVLSYPTAELQGAVRDLWFALDDDRLVPAEQRGALASFLRHLQNGDLLDLQSQYVDLFDRSRSLSLHLYEHIHGESRDRGQAMVNLRERYRATGVDIAANELPDHIPLFLEFLAMQEKDTARAMLAEFAGVFAAIRERLEKRKSPYAVPFGALAALVQAENEVTALPDTDLDDCDDLVALDRAWEEAEVRFGPGDAQENGCPKAAGMLARMTEPARKAGAAR
jgi:nitrate reductase delta subunit